MRVGTDCLECCCVWWVFIVLRRFDRRWVDPPFLLCPRFRDKLLEIRVGCVFAAGREFSGMGIYSCGTVKPSATFLLLLVVIYTLIESCRLVCTQRVVCYVAPHFCVQPDPRRVALLYACHKLMEFAEFCAALGGFTSLLS